MRLSSTRLVSPRLLSATALSNSIKSRAPAAFTATISSSAPATTTTTGSTSPINRFMGNTLSASSFSTTSRNMSQHPIQKSDDEWRAILSPEQFRVLRQQGTERSGTGEYDKHAETGVYNCAGCDAPLYTSKTKFASHCGWPAFFDSIPGAITRHEDRSFGMTRTEIVCTNCGGHLGHVFKGEGYNYTPADERHCVNSVSLKFKDEAQENKI